MCCSLGSAFSASPSPTSSTSHYLPFKLQTNSHKSQTCSVQAAVIILPTISSALSIPAARQQWVISSYSLTFACFLLLWARLADVYGRRLVFILGSLAVTVFTLVIPFSPNEIAFDIFRGLQGLGGAANVPTAIGIIRQTFKGGSNEMLVALSIYSAGFPMGSVIGNILGGLIGQYADWKWVFWVLSILAATVSIAGIFVIPLDPPKPKPSSSSSSSSKPPTIDYPGAFLITTGLLCLMFALTEGNVVGWSTPYIPVLIVLSILLISTFVYWQHYLEHHHRHPLMAVSIFTNPRFAAAQLIMLLFFASFNNYLIYATYYYQEYEGLSVIQTTLRFIPTGVVGLITALLSSQILGRIPGVYIMTFGTTCISLACLLFAVPIPSSTSYWAWGLEAMTLSVFGADTVYPCLTLFTVQSLPPEHQALGGGIVNAVGQFGRALGLAIAVAVDTKVQINGIGKGMDEKEALLAGYRATEYFSFACGMVACVLSAVAFWGRGVVAHKK